MIMIGGGSGTVDRSQPAALFLYVEDVDAVYKRALGAGATSLMPPEDGVFGEERGAGVVDPFGNQWYMAQHDPSH